MAPKIVDEEMALASESDVTVLLRAWRDGDDRALQQLAPLVYGELRERARRYMSTERADHTLESCALVHEAFLRMAEWKRIQWRNREQFFALCSGLMRRVLVDFARAQTSQKRGGAAKTYVCDEAALASKQRAEAFIILDEALDRLSKFQPRKARVVELRFFGGLSVEEAADALGVNPFTILRDWKFAKAWLRREMEAMHFDVS